MSCTSSELYVGEDTVDFILCSHRAGEDRLESHVVSLGEHCLDRARMHGA